MSFDKATMKQVAQHYATQRCQDTSCRNCKFMPYEDPDATIPDGWEPVRNEDLLTKQCAEHNKPRFPWLEGNLEKAADWLVLQSAAGPFLINFAAWEKAVAA